MPSNQSSSRGLNMLRGNYSVLTSAGSLVESTNVTSRHTYKKCSVVDLPQQKSRKTHFAIQNNAGKIVFETNGRNSAIYSLLERFSGQQLESFSWRPYEVGQNDSLTIECTLKAEYRTENVSPENIIDRIVLDTETTGLNPMHDEILRLSIIDGSGQKLFDETYKPEYAESWPDAQRINRISPASVKDRPMITNDLEKIQSLLDRAREVCAFNADFDLAFLGEAGLRLNTAKVRDSMREYAQAFHGRNYIKLVEAARECGYQYNAHDSLADCRATLVVQNRVDNYRERMSEKVSWADTAPQPKRSTKKVSKASARLYTALTWILMFLCIVSIATCFAAPFMLIIAIPACVACYVCFGHARDMREQAGISKQPHIGKHSATKRNDTSARS